MPFYQALVFAFVMEISKFKAINFIAQDSNIPRERASETVIVALGGIGADPEGARTLKAWSRNLDHSESLYFDFAGDHDPFSGRPIER